MAGTGLKKCRPPNLSPRFTTLPMSWRVREEVLVARMAWGGAALSIAEKILCLRPRFSETASITRSTSLTASSVLVLPEISFIVALVSSAAMSSCMSFFEIALLNPPAMLFSMPAREALTKSSLMSTILTAMPADI